MNFIYFLTIIVTIISFSIDQQKTKKALIIGIKKLWKIAPTFVSILISVSMVLYFIPHNLIVDYLGGSDSYFGVAIALIIGAVTVMPGPIVYPLCGILVEKGVSYSVIAAFSSSLMMVGVLTFPMEQAYFGKKFAILRNLISLVMALIIALIFLFAEGRLI